MKANEAPKKIYLPYKDNRLIGLVKTEGVKFNSGVDGHIEYIRTDAFIEKAAEWLDKNLVKYLVTRHVNGCKMTGIDVSLGKDFINYMKGE